MCHLPDRLFVYKPRELLQFALALPQCWQDLLDQDSHLWKGSTRWQCGGLRRGGQSRQEGVGDGDVGCEGSGGLALCKRPQHAQQAILGGVLALGSCNPVCYLHAKP